MTIAFIEDNEGLLKLLSFKAKRLGWTIHTFDNGLAGHRWLVENPGVVDIVILDLMISGMSGWEILFAITDVPIIVLTARTREEDIERVFKHENVLEFVSKPFKLSTLVETIKRNVANMV